MALEQRPEVRTQMLIRRPVADVFAAFVDPSITTQFWFTASSGKLEKDARIRWEWGMYGVSTEVRVLAMEPNRRILIEWDEPPCPVEWRFTERAEGTVVSISNSGFPGTDDEAVAKALDSMGGFTMVLAGAKAWLEHGISLNLVHDHFPEAWVTPATG